MSSETRTEAVALVRLARSCPGVLERAWTRLHETRYWRDGLPLTEALAADVRMEWLAIERDLPLDEGRLN